MPRRRHPPQRRTRRFVPSPPHRPNTTPLQRRRSDTYFFVNVENDNDGKKIYKCPICSCRTGRMAPLYPEDTSLFPHEFSCINKGKIPEELPEEQIIHGGKRKNNSKIKNKKTHRCSNKRQKKNRPFYFSRTNRF